MLPSEEYIRKSIEYNLFWTRIMKEHAIFIESALPPTQQQLSVQAAQYQRQFSRLFMETIHLSNGVLPKELLNSGQFYTDYTETAEQEFQKFIGLEINRRLTLAEYHIAPSYPGVVYSAQLEQQIASLNRRILRHLDVFIRFQTDMVNLRTECKIFFLLYPAALKHLLREAKRYQEVLSSLQSVRDTELQNYISFWNQNMSEHAKSMRGQFDFTDNNSISAANSFATIYDDLAAAPPDRSQALEHTQNFLTFATNVTQNLIECKLRAIMTTLYTDHLLREVSHYNYLLQHGTED